MDRKKVKFKSNRNISFVEELKQKVAEHFKSRKVSKYGKDKIYIKALVMGLLYTVPFFILLSGAVDSFYFVMASWLIMGLGMAGIGLAVMHDANHHSVSTNQRINRIFAKSMYLIGGSPNLWQFQHNVLHHRFTNIDGLDCDISPIPILRLSPHQPHKKIHKYQHLYAWFIYSFITLSFATAKDFVKAYQFMKAGETVSREKSYRMLFIDMAVTKLLYYIIIIGLPLLLTDIPWHWTVLGFLAMHLSSGLMLSVIFQTAHVLPTSEYPQPNSDLEVENSWAVHQLYTTCDFSPNNRFFSWIIGGLNYQVEHHIFPNISHIHYRDLSKIVKQTAQKHNLPYHVNNSFINAIIQHVKMLKMLGRA